MSFLHTQIKAKREASAKAWAEAQSIYKDLEKFDGEIPADKMEQAQKAVDESTRLIDEAHKLEDQLAAVEQLNEAHNRPVNELPTRGRETQREDAQSGRKEAHKAAFLAWSQGDNERARDTLRSAGYSASEAHALISGDGAKGGFLVPEDFRAEVIRREAEVAVMRGIVRVVPTTKDELVMPRVAANAGSYPKAYRSGFSGDWDTEQGSTTETSGSVTVKTQQNQPTFEQVRIPVHNWVPNPVVVSMNLLDDAAAPVESILSEEIAFTKAGDEDLAIIRGTGVDEPSGFLVDSRLATGSGNTARITVGSAAVSYAGLLDLIYGLPSPYAQNGVILMKRATMGSILALETSAGVNLIFGGANAAPDRLMNFPVRFSEFMDAEGSTKYPIAFGDFRRAYTVADRSDLRIQRLNERYAPNVGFQPVCRLGGAVVLPEAIRLGYTS